MFKRLCYIRETSNARKFGYRSARACASTYKLKIGKFPVIFPDFDFPCLQQEFLRQDFFSYHSTYKKITHRRNKRGDSHVLSYGIKIHAIYSSKYRKTLRKYSILEAFLD